MDLLAFYVLQIAMDKEVVMAAVQEMDYVLVT
jgi:hypothetical protein